MEVLDALHHALQSADSVLAWLVSKAPLATAGSAIVATVIAIRGFHKWKTETVGKRNIELAEDILAGFYNARAILEWARFPGSTGGEGQTRPGRGEGGESPEAERQRDAYFWPIERLLAEKDFFNSMQARKYRAMAAFGPDHAKEFDELKQIHGQVMSAAGILIRMSRSDGSSDLADAAKWEAIIGQGIQVDEQGNLRDPVADKIEALINRVEAFYGAVLRSPASN